MNGKESMGSEGNERKVWEVKEMKESRGREGNERKVGGREGNERKVGKRRE